jgi:hypothetical protein
MDLLAQAVIMTAQGVAFIQGGEEFLRSKGGNDNSYIANIYRVSCSPSVSIDGGQNTIMEVL